MEEYTDKYLTDLDSAKDMLDKYGVAIIPNVLSIKEKNEVINGVWDHLEYASSKWEIPIDREKNITWKIDNFSPLHSMLIQHHSIGHCQTIWDIRQNPKIVKIFQTLWNEEEMVTSFDGISIHFPPEENGKPRCGWQTGTHKSKWYHSDQSFLNNKLECYQTWYTPLIVDEGDATLAFLEKSHLFHKSLRKKYNITEKDNWYRINENEYQTYVEEYKCKPRRIKCPANSLVLWDSRVIHFGAQPLKDRVEPNVRMCIYICMLPRSLCTDKQLKLKQKRFNELRLTTHWPVESDMFSKNPRKWSSSDVKEEILLPPSPKLTKLGKSLAGF